MAPIGRLTVAVPRIAPPAALLTLGQPPSVVSLPSAHPVLNSPIQVQNVVVHCAGHKDQMRLSRVTRDTRQEDEVSSCKNVQEKANILSSTLVALAAATLIAGSCVNEAQAVETLEFDVGTAFERTCAGCHSGGGNILQPGYGEKCTPRGQCTFGPRLSEEDIRALAEFVKLRADHGWPK